MENPFFYIVDVFAEEKYAGNQLAVCRNVRRFSDADLQRIAKEMNYSETTFILSEEKRDDGYDVRIFTPSSELTFAGHPTLGTAYVIHREIESERAETIKLNLKVGQIPVTFSKMEGHTDILWMKQIQPDFGGSFDVESVARILCLDETDFDVGFPIQDVSTGTPAVIVPLRSLDAVRRAVIDKNRYNAFIKKAQAKAFLIFCPETYEEGNHLNVRFFADFYGVPEDPATGSANGCLAGYLVKHHYFKKDRIDIRVEQGYEIGRPSRLYLKAEKTDSGIDVFVGGRVFMVAKGELL